MITLKAEELLQNIYNTKIPKQRASIRQQIKSLKTNRLLGLLLVPAEQQRR